MKYAVVGQGFIWPRHKEAIERTGGEVALTCDKGHNPAKPDFTDWLQMYHSPKFRDVDAVVVLTPNYLHSAMVREALYLGKRVLCEKPLTIFRDFRGLEGANVVLQLRYNPLVRHLKRQRPRDISIRVKAHREAEYWQSWKGQHELSGGILYNMSIHYLDLLIYLLGTPDVIIGAETTRTKCKGDVKFSHGVGSYDIELTHEPMKTVREITVDGQTVDLEGATIPLKGGEAIANLHVPVYEDFVRGSGITLHEARPSLDLVEELIQYG